MAPSRPPHTWPLSTGAAASPGGQTIASFALSYSRSLRLLRPEGIRMTAAGTGRRLGNSITEASGFVRGSSLEPYRIVGTSRIISDDGKV
jgi:hypothetical protein